jgi:hypothetical protein
MCDLLLGGIIKMYVHLSCDYSNSWVAEACVGRLRYSVISSFATENET